VAPPKRARRRKEEARLTFCSTSLVKVMNQDSRAALFILLRLSFNVCPLLIFGLFLVQLTSLIFFDQDGGKLSRKTTRAVILISRMNYAT